MATVVTDVPATPLSSVTLNVTSISCASLGTLSPVENLTACIIASTSASLRFDPSSFVTVKLVPVAHQI